MEDFETLQVHVGSNSIRSERLRGDYEQTDMFHNGARYVQKSFVIAITFFFFQYIHNEI